MSNRIGAQPEIAAPSDGIKLHWWYLPLYKGPKGDITAEMIIHRGVPHVFRCRSICDDYMEFADIKSWWHLCLGGHYIRAKAKCP